VAVKNGVDSSSVEGVVDTPYAIADFAVSDLEGGVGAEIQRRCAVSAGSVTSGTAAGPSIADSRDGPTRRSTAPPSSPSTVSVGVTTTQAPGGETLGTYRCTAITVTRTASSQ
jgi:hypothetical protein